MALADETPDKAKRHQHGDGVSRPYVNPLEFVFAQVGDEEERHKGPVEDAHQRIPHCDAVVDPCRDGSVDGRHVRALGIESGDDRTTGLLKPALIRRAGDPAGDRMPWACMRGAARAAPYAMVVGSVNRPWFEYWFLVRNPLATCAAHRSMQRRRRRPSLPGPGSR